MVTFYYISEGYSDFPLWFGKNKVFNALQSGDAAPSLELCFSERWFFVPILCTLQQKLARRQMDAYSWGNEKRRGSHIVGRMLMEKAALDWQ
ncbi:hypothetical protein OUZ56_015189 [Daphnia magna]|uniref:Uncharacterized protein n=1 Tax=Daphnia magna TaxID=35525 RepID=A0ABR0AM28_9CRUS|nr:hypothetical protein OUZ56_015189 [Daphnia magna]